MMAGKCSPCGNTGNNSTTCSSSRYVRGGGGLRLFGVQLNISSPMKKSFSMDCLSSSSYPNASCSPSPSSSSSSLISIDETTDKMSSGYQSDGLMGRAQERKKGVPWSEEEHRAFLAGLEKLGKGDWRGISRNFVTTRTPTQVASHAQKYFLRQNSLNKKKRRSSLFDVVGSGGRVAYSTDLFKFKEPSLSYEVGVPTLSLDSKAHAFNAFKDKATLDLNSSSKEETHLPSCLRPMPNCPTLVGSSLISPALHSSSTMAQPQLHLALPDLELTISSSRLLDQRSTRGALFNGRINVT